MFVEQAFFSVPRKPSLASFILSTGESLMISLYQPSAISRGLFFNQQPVVFLPQAYLFRIKVNTIQKAIWVPAADTLFEHRCVALLYALSAFQQSYDSAHFQVSAVCRFYLLIHVFVVSATVAQRCQVIRSRFFRQSTFRLNDLHQRIFYIGTHRVFRTTNINHSAIADPVE